jgi:hypothetical protein
MSDNKDQRITSLFPRSYLRKQEIVSSLVGAGWMCALSIDLGGDNIALAAELEKTTGHIRLKDLLDSLPILNEQGELFEGYEISRDEKSRQPVVKYEGEDDDRLQEVIDAMSVLFEPIVSISANQT